MKNILVLNGPNLNLTGSRQREIYGYEGLDDINSQLKTLADSYGLGISFFQTNHEGVIIDILQEASKKYSGVILNAGAYAHYSYAIRDAVDFLDIPVIEVHMSNIYIREEFRKTSVLSSIATKTIVGYGKDSYKKALKELNDILNDTANDPK